MNKPTTYEISVCPCGGELCGGKHVDWKEVEHGDWMKSADVWPILNAASKRIGELERELLARTSTPQAQGEGLITECCLRKIANDERFCPRCGWEARVLLSTPQAQGANDTRALLWWMTQNLDPRQVNEATRYALDVRSGALPAPPAATGGNDGRE